MFVFVFCSFCIYKQTSVYEVRISYCSSDVCSSDLETLDRLEGEGRIAFRYAEDVNGSRRSIAGVLNDSGNVLGMMPHPERLIEDAQGGDDGRRLFEGLISALN